MGGVPTWPRLLGLAGLLPQLGFLLTAVFASDSLSQAARILGAAYAGLIFTFLGGAWWGIAASAPAAERRNALAWLWIASVLPSLMVLSFVGLWLEGWLVLEQILVMLSASVLIALAVDARIGTLAPRWWMQLRVPLSTGLGLATLALALVPMR